MIQGVDAILLSSENARRLAEFYRDVVGLEIITEMEVGTKGKMGFELETGRESLFFIMDHSKVKGRNKEPERSMLNFVGGYGGMGTVLEHLDTKLQT